MAGDAMRASLLEMRGGWEEDGWASAHTKT
jgi:hypothetical protein